MKNINAAVILLLVLGLFLTGCTSTTRITSEPPGATVYLNGEAVGETPYVHEDSKISFSRSNLTLSLEGYEDYHTLLVKDEEVDPGAVVGGILFYWPFIWTLGYHPNHHYILEPLNYQDVGNDLPRDKVKKLSELNELYKEGIIDAEELEILKDRILEKDE